MTETPTAPDDSVYGRVTDTKGQPIIAATVTIEGSQKGTLTGADGTFELTEVTTVHSAEPTCPEPWRLSAAKTSMPVRSSRQPTRCKAPTLP